MRQGRTLEEVARQSGFTRSLLSKIETGRTHPPVATLTKIVGVLGLPLASLFDESSKRDGAVMDSAASRGRDALAVTDKGYRFALLAAERPDKVMQPFFFVAERGKVKASALTHAGEEFVYVLEGEMRYRVGAVEYRLGPGDSLYFDAELEHDIEPVSREVKYLAVFSDDARPAAIRARSIKR